MKINIDRLKENLLRVGEIGRTEGQGITRLAFSSEYEKAADVLKKLMRSANLEIYEDSVGNIFGKRLGERPELPTIMMGSHLDTVRNGGLFDGALGVIAALECMIVLNKNNYKTNHSIEMAVFNAEEGSEMGGTFGSRAMLGLIDLEGDTLNKRLSNYNLSIEDLEKSVRNKEQIKAYLEMHIEQGADLYNKELSVGIVEGIVGITRYNVIANGDSNHAGTTPMKLRKDALTGAAKLILKIENIAKEIGEPFVATVGTIKLSPGAVNVIPGQVEFVVELRDLQKKRIKKAVKRIKKQSKSIADIDFNFELIVDKNPVMLNNNIIKIIKKISENQNINYQVMASGAGHDAQAFANEIPTGLLFVPSKEGKSHCPEEWTEWKDIEIGADLLLNTVINLD